jgi:eukaryotic-like serine/threonine-protein kinase
LINQDNHSELAGPIVTRPPESLSPDAKSQDRTRSQSATPTDESERRAIRRVSAIALWAWPSFHALDIFMILALYPEAPYPQYLLLRILGEFGVYGVFELARRSAGTLAMLRAVHLASFAFMAFAISLMALNLGGLHSAYVHGVSIVLLVRAMLVPARFWRALPQAALIALTFPAVMLVAWALDPQRLASWGSAKALALFASHYVFVIGSMVVGSAASHLAWAAEQQIYRARRLGRYRLEAPLARGGMGEVWLAWDEALSRNVALKLLRGRENVASQTLARFEREARAASKLSDPHTIRIFDFGASDDGIHFIVMEYLPGADLGALVESHGPLPPARAVRLMRQACLSLAEAHEAGIVHRDVKPRNLYVTHYEEDHDFLKVLDFGIAWVAQGDLDPHLTRTGLVPGTPAFMAPELRLGHRGDVRSDIYSLGATLNYLLTGAAPNAPESSGIRPPVEQPRPPSVSFPASVPASLAALVSRSLSFDPGERPQSARELASALAGCDGLGSWTEEQARAFWLVTHREAMAGWAAPTLAP